MYEMMIDLETLDTKPSAVVLSIGAVVWETFVDDTGHLAWKALDRFIRVLDIQKQLDRRRTVSQSTLLWWQDQSSAAKAEAFNSVRQPVLTSLVDFHDFAANNRNVPGDPISVFWASPVAFDLPIWEDLAMTFGGCVPWKYNQRYDVRTVIREACYSADGHVHFHNIGGVPHTPVFDCEWQISLLTAARDKAKRRVAS